MSLYKNKKGIIHELYDLDPQTEKMLADKQIKALTPKEIEQYIESRKPKTTDKEDKKEVSSEEKELENLRADYEAVFGKPPHHKMKAESIKEALNEEKARLEALRDNA